jgi:hypothetical protein
MPKFHKILNIDEIVQQNRDLCKEEDHPYKEKRGDVVSIQNILYTPLYCSNCNSFLKFDIPKEKEIDKYNSTKN